MSLEIESSPLAYRLGCLFAVLEQAQRGALGDVNASIVDRYYGTASSVPYSVFPRLIAGCQNHLSKIRKNKPGQAVNMDKRLGEIVAWILGWNLLLEYAISNVAVAISWSKYFVDLLEGLGMHVPEFLTMDFLSAKRAFLEASPLLQSGQSLASLPVNLREGYLAYESAPTIFGWHFLVRQCGRPSTWPFMEPTC